MGEYPERTIPLCGTSRGGRGSGEGAGFFALARGGLANGGRRLAQALAHSFVRIFVAPQPTAVAGAAAPSAVGPHLRWAAGPPPVWCGGPDVGKRPRHSCLERALSSSCRPGETGSTTAVDLRASTQCIMMIIVLNESHCPLRGGCLMEKNKRPLTSRNLVVFRHTGSLGKQTPHGSAGPPTLRGQALVGHVLAKRRLHAHS